MFLNTDISKIYYRRACPLHPLCEKPGQLFPGDLLKGSPEIFPGGQLKTPVGNHVSQSVIEHLISKHDPKHVEYIGPLSITDRPVLRPDPVFKFRKWVLFRGLYIAGIVPEDLVSVDCPPPLHLFVEMIG